MFGRTREMRGSPSRKALALLAASTLAATLCFPSVALAQVKVDGTELAQGSNSVGGGTAELSDSSLTMSDVKAEAVYTDESLDISFTGGNDIETFTVGGDATASLGFSGENEVEDIYVQDSANVTIEAAGHNDFEEVNALGNSNVTINVSGENEFESIIGTDDANITIKGKTCQKRDEIKLAEGEDEEGISTERGELTIDHVTISLESKESFVKSSEGKLVVDTSKIEGDDENENTEIFAGKEMTINESVIEITGTVSSKGQMTINHSDVEVAPPNEKYEAPKYRVFSYTGIELIDEENGEVEEGEFDGTTVYYVDTDDNDGFDVDLEADGEPAYYDCGRSKPAKMMALMPKMGDEMDLLTWLFAFIALCSLAVFSQKKKNAQSVFPEDADDVKTCAEQAFEMSFSGSSTCEAKNSEACLSIFEAPPGVRRRV